MLFLHHGQDASPLQVLRFGRHPSLVYVHSSLLQDVTLTRIVVGGTEDTLRKQSQHSRGDLRPLEMQTDGVESLSVGIEISINHVGGENMFRVGVRVAEKVGKRDRGKGIAKMIGSGTWSRERRGQRCLLVAEVAFEKLDHV